MVHLKGSIILCEFSLKSVITIFKDRFLMKYLSNNLCAKIIRLIFGLSIVITLYACEKSTVTNVATADVFIKTIISQGDTLFGLAHSAYSYNRMISVSVKSPEGDSVNLPVIADKGISIYKNPSLESGDFSKNFPATGVYAYNITFKDNSKQVLNNTLGADFLLPAVIDSLNLATDGQSVKLSWNPVQNAQFYQIRITKGDDEVIPARLYSPEGGLKVQFPISYFTGYMPGNFTLELDGLLFESTSYTKLQAIGVTYGTLTLP